jgi:GNAT superfamily N-acetyltransferase
MHESFTIRAATAERPRLSTSGDRKQPHKHPAATTTMNAIHKLIPSQSTYPLRHSVLWPNIALEDQGLPEDDRPGVIHFGSFVEGREEPVCIVTFVCDELARDVQFRKFATDSEYQSRGIGSSLLRYAMDQVLSEMKGQEEVKVWCNARTTALHFYERFGLHELPDGKRYTKYGEGGKAIDYVQIGGMFKPLS